MGQASRGALECCRSGGWRLLPAPEQNRRAFTPDDWRRSGDICRRAAEGNFVVEGRDKDMINRGGEKISADQVENLVYRLPAVAQVAAIAVPDLDIGERVCIHVATRIGEYVSLEQIRTPNDAAGVARYKLPEYLVMVDGPRPPRSERSTREPSAPMLQSVGGAG